MSGHEKRPLGVLLVSDNQAFREELADALGREGHRVSVFTTPREARDALPIEGLDLAVVDYTFSAGDQSGLALADELHATNRNFPIIVVSCHWTPQLGAECGRRWATFCLRKRCTPGEVIAMARDVVRMR